MSDRPVSERSDRIGEAAPFRMLFDFARKSGYQERRLEPGVLDFTFGDPHEMPIPEYVEALRAGGRARGDELWFAYKFSLVEAQEAAAASLRRVVDLPWTADRIRMTTGGFGAITLAMKSVADPGDEVVYSLPPWFLYEALALEAGLVPVKVRVDPDTFDLDLDGDRARPSRPAPGWSSSTPPTTPPAGSTPSPPCARWPTSWTRRRRATAAGSTSSPTSPTTGSCSTARGSAARRSSTPTRCSATATARRCWPPGSGSATSRCHPRCPDADQVIDAVESLQVAAGWLFPNAVMQYAVPRLEAAVARRGPPPGQARPDDRGAARDGLRRRHSRGHLLPLPEVAAARRRGVRGAARRRRACWSCPGGCSRRPGFFRICLTATMDIDRGEPAPLPAVLTGDAATS